MFVVCTESVTPPPVMFSPAVNLTTDVPESKLSVVLVYCTYKVAGSDPLAGSTLSTLPFTLEVAPVNSIPIKVDVSAGN